MIIGFNAYQVKCICVTREVVSSGDQLSILKCASSLGRFFSSGEMGQKRDLTDAEKAKMVKSISGGCSTPEISKILGRDHRTIKCLLQIVNRVATNMSRRKDANNH